MSEMDEDFRLMFERHKRIATHQVGQLTKLLNAIKPAPNNFLFTDLIGRIIWNATATTNTIRNLAEREDDYGISSILRKLLECKILIHYMFRTKNRSEVIARILAYGFFDQTENVSGLELKEKRAESLEDIRKIVAGFGEDDAIISYYTGFVGSKRKHWHWIGEGFKQAAKDLDPNDESSFTMYSQMLHVNVLEDYLEPTKEINYQSPVKSSTRRLAGLLGISRFINMSIMETVESNATSIGFDQTYFSTNN